MSENLKRVAAAVADRYSIEREVGRGGMAHVYLGRDLRHDRLVAIKVLRRDLAESLGKERFLREIQIAAKLHHPHILALYDSGDVGGVLYYVMPYVDGESLAARIAREQQLPLEDALLFTREVADALSYAHDYGVVHRDIKPDNIMLSGGHAIVTDFGIARAVSESADAALTGTGLAIGTPAYMSPEQAAAGKEIDGRSDLYALGCVLYEMLTGGPPFRGATPQAIMARHASDTAPPIRTVRETVPVFVDSAITKSLAKVPADRFATAREMRLALTIPSDLSRAVTGGPLRRVWGQRAWVAVGAVATIGVAGLLLTALPRLADSGPEDVENSVAVLPCANLSGDPGQEFFSVGMTEDLISQLSKIADLKVISIYSVQQYKQTTQSSPEIGAELGARALVRCSARQAPDQVAIGVQLIDAQTDGVLWAETYVRDRRAVFAIQSDVAIQVAGALRAALTPSERVRIEAQPTEDAALYDLYLRGRYFWNSATIPGLNRAVELYDSVLTIDSSFALAHSGLADVYWSFVTRWSAAPNQYFPLARTATQRALALDSNLAEAHASLARIKHRYDWDWDGADASFRRALELDPNYADGHLWYALYLSSVGRYDDALTEVLRAKELAPLAPYVDLGVGAVQYFAARYEEALQAHRQAAELDSTFVNAKVWIGLTLVALERYDEASMELQQAVTLTNRHPLALWPLGYAYAQMGRREDAREILQTLVERSEQEFIQAYGIAAILFALGDYEHGLDWTERAYEAREYTMSDFANGPTRRQLSDNPRFRTILQRMDLTTRRPRLPTPANDQ